jgi:hypothetical protein
LGLHSGGGRIVSTWAKSGAPAASNLDRFPVMDHDKYDLPVLISNICLALNRGD